MNHSPADARNQAATSVRTQTRALTEALELRAAARFPLFRPERLDRDAADVAIYTQFGEPVELLRMDVTVERMSAPSY